MRLNRMFVNINNVRTHVRICGRGAPLILLHQSPRSGAEFEDIIPKWANRFCVIAPDIPGYGNSDELGEDADIAHFAEWILELSKVLGLKRPICYGFHTGATILLHAIAKQPNCFLGGFLAGVTSFTEEEKEVFGEKYLPTNPPTAYGEHLVWLWSRLVEQSFFFPWYSARNDNRLAIAHNNAMLIHAMALDMIEAGDAYRTGYRAVINAQQPSFQGDFGNFQIGTYKADPLLLHMERFKSLPKNWQLRKFENAVELKQSVYNHVDTLETDEFVESEELRSFGYGFATFKSPHFNGNIRYIGDETTERVHIHAPLLDIETISLESGEGAVELPGHGLSDDVNCPLNLQSIGSVILEFIATYLPRTKTIILNGFSGVLVNQIDNAGYEIEFKGSFWPNKETRARIIKELEKLSPTSDGLHLLKAWQIIRHSKFFFPFFDPKEENAIEFDELKICPSEIAKEHKAFFRAKRGKEFLEMIFESSPAKMIQHKNYVAPKIVNLRNDLNILEVLQ